MDENKYFDWIFQKIGHLRVIFKPEVAVKNLKSKYENETGEVPNADEFEKDFYAVLKYLGIGEDI